MLGAELYPPSGGLRLESVRVEDDAQRPWLDVSAAAPGGVSGTATVKSGAGCSIRGGSASSVVTKCETATPSASAGDGSGIVDVTKFGAVSGAASSTQAFRAEAKAAKAFASPQLKTDGFEAVFGDVQQIGAAPHQLLLMRAQAQQMMQMLQVCACGALFP